MKKIALHPFGLFLISALFLYSCGSSKKEPSSPSASRVVIHSLSDPEMLNPINYSDAGADGILKNLFQSLLHIDFRTKQLVPILAEDLPQVEKTPDNGMRLTYRIRKEAAWDNGTPVTAGDVEFSLKVLKNPWVNNTPKKPYFEFISDVVLYPDDPLKITMVCNRVYIRAIYSSGAELFVIPKYFYDKQNLLSDIALPEVTDSTKTSPDKIKKLKEFAKEFNTEKYAREKEFICGSGAYSLSEWTTGQRIVLSRKKTWWGDKLAEKPNMFFEAEMPEMEFRVINDQTTALVALKSGQIDVMTGIKSKDFVDLPKSAKFSGAFHSYNADYLGYSYIGLNTKRPALSTEKTRQALAHLVNVDNILKTVGYGFGNRTIGPIHPSLEKYYDKDIVPYPFDVEKAKQLLSEDGWKDSDGDGILEKMIDGKQVPFKIVFSVNAGNDERKATALLLKEDARKAGIDIEVAAQEWSVYVGNLKKHNFDMYIGAWVSEYAPMDLTQLFHTSSANNGSNYCSWGNAASDALLDSIKTELDENVRAAMYKRLQRALHEQVPYVFLTNPVNKMAISKKFDNAYTSGVYPGFWPAGFKPAQSGNEKN